MLNLVVVAQPAHSLHYLGNTSLVIGTKQSGSISHDDVLAYMCLKLRELSRARHDTLREHDVAAVVVLDDTRTNVGTATVGRCIIVRDESDCGDVLLGVSLKRGVDVALLVHLNIAQALALKFLLKVFGEYQLLGSTRNGIRLFARLGVELGVVQKSFGYFHFYRYVCSINVI